jgi:hypothetical protein
MTFVRAVVSVRGLVRLMPLPSRSIKAVSGLLWMRQSVRIVQVVTVVTIVVLV